MTLYKKLIFALLLIFPISVSCFEVVEDSLVFRFSEVKLFVPSSYDILSAKWSPNGANMLILVVDSDFFSYWESEYRLIIARSDTLLEKKPSLLVRCIPPIIQFWLNGICEITFPRKKLRPDYGTCWINDKSILLGFDKPYQRIEKRYSIMKYDLLTNRLSIISEEISECFEVMDVFERDFLVTNIPESEYWFLRYCGIPGLEGVLPLYKKDIKKEFVPERITSLHPDSTYVFSVVRHARYLSKNKIIVHKIIMKEENFVQHSIKLLNLKNESVKLINSKRLKVEGSAFEALGYISGFEVSPNKKWITCLKGGKKIEFLSIGNGNPIEIDLNNLFGSKFLEGKYRESNWFEILDWSPDGKKIMLKRRIEIQEWDGYNWNDREEYKLYSLDVPEVFRAD